MRATSRLVAVTLLGSIPVGWTSTAAARHERGKPSRTRVTARVATFGPLTAADVTRLRFRGSVMALVGGAMLLPPGAPARERLLEEAADRYPWSSIALLSLVEAQLDPAERAGTPEAALMQRVSQLAEVDDQALPQYLLATLAVRQGDVDGALRRLRRARVRHRLELRERARFFAAAGAARLLGRPPRWSREQAWRAMDLPNVRAALRDACRALLAAAPAAAWRECLAMHRRVGTSSHTLAVPMAEAAHEREALLAAPRDQRRRVTRVDHRLAAWRRLQGKFHRATRGAGDGATWIRHLDAAAADGEVAAMRRLIVTTRRLSRERLLRTVRAS